MDSGYRESGEAVQVEQRQHLGVPLDAVVAQENRHVLLDGAGRAQDRVEPARRPADQLGGALLGRAGDLQCPFLGVVGARGLVAAVDALVKAPVARSFGALAPLGVCHVCL
jgi:hypothetical protein